MGKHRKVVSSVNMIMHVLCGTLLGILLIGGVEAKIVLAERVVDLGAFFTQEIGFSKKDLQKLDQGQVVITRIDTDTKEVLALFSIVRIDVPK